MAYHVPMDERTDRTGLEGLLPPWEGPAILLVDLDAFFASVEQLDHPGWRSKPVIVGGDADKHGVVSTCSYEARAFGVRSAMPAKTAERLCPDAIWTHGHFARYREMSAAIMAVIGDETPFVQQVSIDEAFADITPTRVNTEHPVEVARRIQARVEELGVTCSIGLATTKSVAKIASDMDKPRGLTVVFPGTERAFLGPLPVRALSGVGKAAEGALHARGIRTLGEMAQASDAALHAVFGKSAAMMRARADGTELADIAAELEADEGAKSVSHAVTFAEDLTERDEMLSALAAIAGDVGRRVRKKGLRGRTLTLRIRYDDLTTHTAQTVLPHPSDDELYFAPHLAPLLDTVWRPGISVRLLGVGLSGFKNDAPYEQPALFDSAALEPEAAVAAPLVEDDEKRSRLLRASDALKDRFGEDAVRFGHHLRHAGNHTGSSSKNPADYR